MCKKYKKKSKLSPHREVFMGSRSWKARDSLLSQSFYTTKPVYCANVVKTSKYTWWSFLPKNLFEQFRRVANFFFLLVAIIQLAIPGPVSPVPSVAALVFVIVVTAIKQAYEDVQRHKADDQVNNAPATVFRNGKSLVVKSRNISVGDLVRIKEDGKVPCDILLMRSSVADGSCFVTTANIDGESNLKRLEIPSPILQEVDGPKALEQLEAVIECEHPHPDLYKFAGRLCCLVNKERKVIPLNASNLLICGSTLKETSYVYGCALYTGPETKMAQNLKIKSNKFSTAERTMNIIIVVVIIFMFVAIIFCTVMHHLVSNYPIQRQLNLNDERSFYDFLMFLIIFNYVVPVALYVSIEIQKFIGAMFFRWDFDMYDAENDIWPVCNTSDISEELGQINYLFSDKTGTLTENLMVLRNITVDGRSYRLMDSGVLVNVDTEEVIDLGDLAKEGTLAQPISSPRVITHLRRFFINLTLNHSVQVAQKEGYSTFIASSPDEKAFLEAASQLGIEYKGIDANQETIIDIKGTIHKFKILLVLDFDPTRKCMSVIVKDLQNNKIFLMTKGAESSLQDIMIGGNIEDTYLHIEEYAIVGLRTLVFAERELDAATFASLEELVKSARVEISDREAKIAEACKSVEQKLTCVGATGVEDLLQIGVRDTLVALSRAGIHIWVLTGDRKSTAINISFSCDHLNRNMDLHELTDFQTIKELDAKLTKVRLLVEVRTKKHSLVVDGKTITMIMNSKANAWRKKSFSEVSRRCDSVLCCRMSPLHKAQIVAMVKGFPSRPVCAAIGDGANDVSMIQEAHVGIGLMGKEGRQAVRCSDFAFSKFRFLKKAVLVHGHWYYYRISFFIMYVNYKSVAFIIPQLIYAFYNLFSAATLFESFYLMAFNLMFTSLPIIAFGVMEQNYSKEVLLNEPELYKTLTKNRYMKPIVFVIWVLLAIYHASVCFFIPCGTLGESLPINKPSYAIYSNWDFGFIVYTSLVFTINGTLFLITKYWTWFNYFIYIGTILAFFLFAFIYSIFPARIMYLSFVNVFGEIIPWLCLLTTLGIALMPCFALIVALNYRQDHIRSKARAVAYEKTQMSLNISRVSQFTQKSMKEDDSLN